MIGQRLETHSLILRQALRGNSFSLKPGEVGRMFSKWQNLQSKIGTKVARARLFET